MVKSWIKSKTVVVTGCSGGLGFSISKLLVEKYGAFVIGICRNEQKMLDKLNEITTNKENFSYRVFDVRDKEKWAEFASELELNGKAIDVLINNAGFMLPFNRFENISDEEVNEIVETNFKANITSIKTLMPILKKSKYATIVNVCSASSLCAIVGESLYSATKFAMKGLTDAIRVENKGKINVVGVYPGFIKTDIMQRQKTDAWGSKLISMWAQSADKAGGKIIKATIKHRKNVVVGFDGKLLGFFAKFFPVFTANILAFALKKSKHPLFKDVFEE